MMKAVINLITIWTNDIDRMKDFYTQVLGFEIKSDLGGYVEFESSGVRFAICKRSVMYQYSDEYWRKAFGQVFELAFPCENPDDADESYKSWLRWGRHLFIHRKICHGIRTALLQIRMEIYEICRYNIEHKLFIVIVQDT